jgi:glycosyltransferase involved in cell wall biosynthesis
MKKKVLFVVPTLQGGGAERVMVTLANHLDRNRYTPILALGLVEGPYLKELARDVNIHSLRGAWRARQAIPAVLGAVWSLRPHVVLSTLGLNLAVALARPFFPPGTRVILREGNTVSAYLRISASDAHFKALAYKLLYRMADMVICQSDFMLNDLAVNFSLSRQKLVRIYNPVDIEHIRTMATQIGNPFAEGGLHLLTIGRLDHQKGFDVLLQAFKLVLNNYPQTTLTILGEGDVAELKHLVQDPGILEATHFLGFQSNPYPYLKQADLFVSSSRYEGFSNVILEALALGTPVVATDCPGGNREVIEEGVNGWLARVDDVESLTQTICKGIRDRVTLDAAAIQAGCEAKFSVNHIVELYQDQF